MGGLSSSTVLRAICWSSCGWTDGVGARTGAEGLATVAAATAAVGGSGDSSLIGEGPTEGDGEEGRRRLGLGRPAAAAAATVAGTPGGVCGTTGDGSGEVGSDTAPGGGGVGVAFCSSIRMSPSLALVCGGGGAAAAPGGAAPTGTVGSAKCGATPVPGDAMCLICVVLCVVPLAAAEDNGGGGAGAGNLIGLDMLHL